MAAHIILKLTVYEAHRVADALSTVNIQLRKASSVRNTSLFSRYNGENSTMLRECIASAIDEITDKIEDGLWTEPDSATEIMGAWTGGRKKRVFLLEKEETDSEEESEEDSWVDEPEEDEEESG